VEFALGAKCYAPGNSVGVRETSRLISRLRHRQFGVLVTPSHVDAQAYREIRDDGHPVVILAGRDVVELLKRSGLDTPEALRRDLLEKYPQRETPIWQMQDSQCRPDRVRSLLILARAGMPAPFTPIPWAAG
jgi:hypothetical protein